MFRIRRVHDDLMPANRRAIEQAQEILRARLAGLPADEVDNIGERLRNPFLERFQAWLLVAEDSRDRVQGLALVLHDPELHFAFLDAIASARGGGVGGGLYQRVREQAKAAGCRGVFFECQPDELSDEMRARGVAIPAAELRQNRKRLRFYESFGARPIVGTDYEAPVDPASADPMPYLVVDPLGASPPGRSFARKVVRAILERKYHWLCPPEYVARVVASFRDDPVRLRDPRQRAPAAAGAAPAVAVARRETIPLVVNDRHQIHHVRERGYVESPVRISKILERLEPSGLFERREPRDRSVRHIEAVHDPRLVRYLERASREVEEGRSLYPYVFPVRNPDRLPRERSVLAGYFCIDTFTPIHRNSYRAAKRAVDCTLAAAEALLDGRPVAYSLVRPPGHHAEHGVFGGFCYFNNAGVAAHYLTTHGRVAILDIDYHHGNGQQDLFWRRADVLTVSIHGHPRFAYPYFAGFADETGEGEGAGANLNLPLPEAVDGAAYRRALRKALAAVAEFRPVVLVVALGLDPAAGDPTGTWSLRIEDFERNGRLIGNLDLPTLVVQEGGYRTRTLGANALAFFRGLAAAHPRLR
ncbi:MAG TPA: histone deacetylase family protein [Thermoanaerobaculia bacterium]|nr:histone deacetylase family protein [Thermoanaerobaculia bacterium]